MKPFKTYRQQIGILRSRGLVVDGPKAMRALERENYYNVINGYKDPFLQLDASGNVVSPERYKVGSSFGEILKLFTFDRELRNLLLKYLLISENNIKTKLAYRFTQKFKEPHAYLQMKNFSSNPRSLNKVLKLIATLSSLISNKSERPGPVKHYLDNHQGVPLWVLVSYLTIGNISNFYSVLDDSLKDQIAKDFSLEYKKAYNPRYQIPRQTIEDVLKAMNLFRNVCAHEERLYCFKLVNPPSSRHNSHLLNIPAQYLQGSLFTTIAFLKLVLSKKDHKLLISSLSKLFDQYRNSFVSLHFSQVLTVMGFPSNWKTYF